MNNDYKTEFFMSQIQHLRDIRENEKIKISLIFYEGIQGPCVLKTCKNRDLSEVCQKLMEVRHPNVAVVYDYLYANGNTYVIEEFMNGITLREFISENGVFKEKDTEKIIIDVCKGLEILHSQKPPIVHNDINTANIMMKEDGSVKVFDFDISRTYKTGAGKNTRLFGTEEYAAPEHFGYGQSEPRTDIYSLGVTMHEMLTGEQLTQEHKMIYNGKLKKIIKKCVEVDPKKRYFSAKQLRKDLEKKKSFGIKVLKSILSIIVVMILLIAVDIFRSSDSVEEKQLNISSVSEQMPTNENDSVLSPQREEKHEKEQNEIEDIPGDSINENVPEDSGSVPMVSENVPTNENDSGTNLQSDEKEQNQAESSEISNDSESQDKTMKNIYTVNGELRKIVGKNDGSFVFYEIVDNEGYLKTSTGENKKIEGIGEDNDLMYNGITDTLYLLSNDGDIYEVDDNLNLSLVGQCIRYNTDERYTYYSFFSDGKLLTNGIYNGYLYDACLVDSNTWQVVGEGPRVDAVINDNPYAIKWGSETYTISKVDFQGNEIQNYDIADGSDDMTVTDKIYSNHNALYIIGTKDEKEYVYRFNGEEWGIIACLNDYKYYSKTYSDNYAVTQDAIWLYDVQTKVMKEFKLN